jgi:Holin of 3TMs, for gene-transfer release
MSNDITGLGAVADLAGTVINKIWPDKSEQEKQQLANAFAIVQGQLEINKAEASNPSIFVSGWRPAIGWVCGTACAWNWIGLPFVKAALAVYGHPLEINPADIGEMMPILLGMLGLGGLRTAEKINGVAAK